MDRFSYVFWLPNSIRVCMNGGELMKHVSDKNGFTFAAGFLMLSFYIIRQHLILFYLQAAGGMLFLKGR